MGFASQSGPDGTEPELLNFGENDEQEVDAMVEAYTKKEFPNTSYEEL